jgi:nicotinamidase-related amidase
MKSKLLLTAATLLLTPFANAKGASPKTLFELSNVPRPEIRLENSILIVIDAQQEYERGRLPLTGLKDAVRVIRSLLTQARKMGVPVIHVMHEGTSGGLFDPGSEMFKSIPGLEPLANEPVIRKHLPDSFSGTSLNRELEKLGKDRTLILVGFMTHMCITSTAVSALDLGYQTAVVSDAVATRDLRSSSGETIRAEEVNRASLAALQDRIAWLVESRELLSEK